MIYTIKDLLWILLIYACLGWCTEVIHHTIKAKEFTNRGFLNGPYCPIYGVGMILILSFLEPIKNNLVLLVLGSILLTTSLELVVGFFLEKTFGINWWDYSKEKYNFHGYICLKYSILWGLGSVILVDFIHPVMFNLVNLIPYEISSAVLVIFYSLFLVDIIVSVNTVHKFTTKLARLDEIARKMHGFSDEIGKAISDNTLVAMDKSEKLKEDMYLEKLAISELTEEKLNAFNMLKEEKVHILNDELNKYEFKRTFVAYPGMKVKKYKERFADVKNSYLKQKKKNSEEK